MNWLVDAHLPPSLCKWLQTKGGVAVHLGALDNGLRLPDEFIWAYAKENQFVIITKDNDFFDRAILKGSPPQVIFIKVGNCSNKTLFTTLDRFWLHIQNALAQGGALVEVGRERIRAY
jgi:predicted nuclease of predicted toxin-antitoxin system